jgi:hypothetical protein
MKYIPVHLLFFLCLQNISATAQNSVVEKFFQYTNNFQVDSLRSILTEDFTFRRTFTTRTNSKSNFLNDYMPLSKQFNGKFILRKVISEDEPTQYLVEDQSDYLELLDIQYPQWILTIETKGDSIQSVLEDTTDTYIMYKMESKLKDHAFSTWLLLHYPNETKSVLYSTEGLLRKRLLEYVAQKKK